MRDRLFVAVLGNRNSGKSTTWNRLFEATVKTGKIQRSLHLNCAQTVDVFLINGSPQERGVNVKDVLVNPLPQIVLCSTQYNANVNATFNFFFANGYDVFVQWLNPGYGDVTSYQDALGLKDYLLNKGATLQVRDGNVDPLHRVQELRQFILGWAKYRDLVRTKFPV
jgi:hypothetical protein